MAGILKDLWRSLEETGRVVSASEHHLGLARCERDMPGWAQGHLVLRVLISGCVLVVGDMYTFLNVYF